MSVSRRRFLKLATPVLVFPCKLLAASHGVAVSPVGSGLTLNMILDPSWSGAPATWQGPSGFLSQAVTIIQNAYPHVNATLTMHIGYTTQWVSPSIPANPVAPSSSIGTVFYGASPTYPTIRAALAGLSFQSTTLSTLLSNTPAGSSLNGQSSFFLPSSCCKALRLFGLSGGPVSATDPAVDGSVGIGSGWSDTKIIGVLLHEITHAMGRIESFAPFVFSRFTSPGVRDFSTSNIATYFAIDGGTVHLADYSVTQDLADFKNPPEGTGVQDPLDCFGASQETGANQFLSTLDNQLMNALGFQ